MSRPSRLLLAALVVFAWSAQAQRRAVTDSAPRALVAQVLRDEETQGYPPVIRDELDAGGWLAITGRVDLDGDGKAELFVQGRGRVCGANNCQTWIYRVTAHGYEQLLDADGVQEIEARKRVSHGYRDVVTSRGGDSHFKDVTRYSFDGERYRVVECSRRQFDMYDSTGRHLLPKLPGPLVIRVKCEGDGGG